MIRTSGIATIISAMLMLTAAAPHPPQHKISISLKEFASLIELNFPIESIKWETFGSPEDTGGIPGPTEYVLLVAEAKIPANSRLPTAQGSTGIFYVVPESSRDWLSPYFKSLLTDSRRAETDLTLKYGCKPTTGVLKKSGRKASGFSCVHGSSALIYIVIEDFNR